MVRPVLASALLLVALACGAPEPAPESSPAPVSAPGASRFFKGNLHTHSFWSDGDEYPEVILASYKDAGYDFVALSEHNVFAEGERFIDIAEKGGEALLAAYRERFADRPDWVESKMQDGRQLVRLKTFDEYRGLLEEPGSFLLIPGEEITDSFDGRDIHLNATNIAELIDPQGGSSVADVLQRNVDAVLASRERTGQPLFPHVNHPNFVWALTVEDLMGLQGEKFFEVYNGHPLVHNEGDDLRPSTERMWDILLAERLSNGDELMYGLAVDDAHNYHDLDGEHSNPFRGWVMVQADELSAAAIVEALEAGRFYGSSGVSLATIDVTDSEMSFTIDAVPGVEYRTTFIGTRRGYDRSKSEVDADDGAVRYRYSDDIGVVLAEVEGASPRYVFEGDELYVRAKVVSSTLKRNPYQEGEREAAWVQPVVVAAPEE